MLWHALASLDRLLSGPVAIDDDGRERRREPLESVEVCAVRKRPFRRRRNGLVHIGLSDLQDEQLRDAAGLQELTAAYVGAPFDQVQALVDRALEKPQSSLEEWMELPSEGEQPYRKQLRPVRG